jgi:hypothetical protein
MDIWINPDKFIINRNFLGFILMSTTTFIIIIIAINKIINFLEFCAPVIGREILFR